MNFPQNIESKFRFILVSAKRARQLQAGAKPLIQSQSKKVTRIAQEEVAAGLVPIEVPELSQESNEKNQKSKK
ncbi:MAG TPA: DNA-directed RNA polymerase subunit omega [Terriglobia bacterium]|jgi:DNA-directed RNA polymerase subunit omega|nr:DNA-directed RNA polymerase subunit omega [Terriglobia bacterium]